MKIAFTSIVLSLICISAATGQKTKQFIAPQIAFSSELFPEKLPDVAFLESIADPEPKSVLRSPNASLTGLSSDYNWRKDIARSELIKKAALDHINYDKFGRESLPDAGKMAKDCALMRDMNTH